MEPTRISAPKLGEYLDVRLANRRELVPITPPVASIVLRTRGDPASLGVKRELRAIEAVRPV